MDETKRDRPDEFLAGASRPPAVASRGMSRRRFLSLLSATAALAGNAGCIRLDRGGIVAPSGGSAAIAGVAEYFASTFPESGGAQSVLVKTREGRPIHIEGNDRHPELKGKTSLRAIADVLRLYDPEAAEPTLLRAGDRVRFRAIDRAEFDRLSARALVLCTPARVE